MKEDYFSAKNEPTQRDGEFECDPSEQTASRIKSESDEVASIRDSVLNEPALNSGSSAPLMGEWIAKKKSQCTVLGNLSVTVLVALIGGPFAIVGALLTGQQGMLMVMYVVLFGPVTEELLKQSGMVYMLEKKPYRIFTSWQFVFCAMVSAFLFAAIENFIYIHIYSMNMEPAEREALASFRWTVCTVLHVGCSMIASIGLIRVWKRQLADGKNADLSVAYPYFLAAMIIHGAYNLWAMLINPVFQAK